MKYCHQCGTQNENDAVFCASCGAKQTGIQETKSNAEIPEQQNELYASNVAQINTNVAENAMPEENPVQRTGPVSNLIKFKGYLIYLIVACFIYSLFSAVNIHVTGGTYEDGDREGMRGDFHFSGLNMITGALPKFNVAELRNGRIREREYTNEDLENASMRSFQKGLLRTPLFFRMPYYLLFAGLICYLISIFAMDPLKNYFLNSFSKAICFIGVAGIVWGFGEFSVWAEKVRTITSAFRERVGLEIDVNFSIGIWGLLLSFGFLLGEYMYRNIAPLFKNLKSIELKPVQNI